jgi:hypothetical protein
MNATDRAIIVGIRWYPGKDMENLNASLNDARAFRDWLLEPNGGGLTPNQIDLIISDENPPVAGTIPQPVADQVWDALDRLELAALDNLGKGQGRRVGRRLYLYFSGHGFAPQLNQTVVLMANASPSRLIAQIPGRAYADWFYRACYFDEVLLFMDCCRNLLRGGILIPPHFTTDITGANVDQIRYFYGFATKWSRLSRERPIPDPGGPVRSVFTAALLAGLRGGAADPTGRVTAATLGNYLFSQMKTFLSPADLANPDIPQEPDYRIYPPDGSQFVIVDGFGPATVTVERTTGPADSLVRLLDPTFQPVTPTAGAPPGTFQLTPGVYLAQITSADGQQVLKQQVITLTTERNLHVKL